jgi:hypothetical protein
MHHLCQYYAVTEGGITIGCDGSEALKKSFIYKLDIEDPCYDLLAAIHRLRTLSPLTWSFRHVKGHQDSLGQEPDHWAELNILMDSKAKRFMPTATLLPRQLSIWMEPWSLWISGQKLTGRISSILYSLVHDERAKAYWATKTDLDNLALEATDWSCIGTAMQEIPRTQIVFLSKHVAGMCGVGKFMLCWKEWDHDNCPWCGSPEDSTHVWRCSGQNTNEVWGRSLSALRSWMAYAHTDPELASLILTSLNNWRYTVPAGAPPLRLADLVQYQHTIGWGKFLEGWLSNEWQAIQQRYYDSLCMRRTGRWWTMALIKKLWDIVWDLWEHRNNILHEAESRPTTRDLQRLTRDITTTFHDLSTYIPLPPHDMHLLQLPLMDLLQKSFLYKCEWLCLATFSLSSIKSSSWNDSTRTSRMLQGMRCSLSEWLSTANSG